MGPGGVGAALVFDDGAGGGPALYLGGDFSSAGAVLADGIVRWNGSSFEPVGSGLLGASFPVVAALAVHDDGSGPVLFVAGWFHTAGGVPAANIARWDGTSFSAVGAGVGPMVLALAVFDDGSGAGPCLIAGGDFATAGGLPAAGLARWDGAGWTEVGGGVGGSSSAGVSSLAVFDDGSGPALYVAGHFDMAGTTPVHHIARWDGASWTDVGGGVSGSYERVHALAVYDDGGGPALYAGGEFTAAGAARASHIARWDGQAWKALGRGTDAGVQALYVHDDGSGPTLYVGGSFNSAGDKAASGVARWSGAGWTTLGAGLQSGGAGCFATVDLAGPGNPPLFVGGGFLDAGNQGARNAALWDGAGWSGLASGAGLAVTGEGVNALAEFDDGSGPALYAGGSFLAAGTAPTPEMGLVRWNGRSWNSLPPSPWAYGRPLSLAVFDPGTGPGLYVGWTGSGITMWNGSAWDPGQAIGTQGYFSSSVNALATHDDGTGTALYAGGNFTSANGGAANGSVLRWDGQTCSSVGNPPWPVNALLSFDDGTGSALYAGAGSTSYPPAPGAVSRWDGLSWTQLGGDPGGTVLALAGLVEGSGPVLYAGGTFGVVRWSGTVWVPLGAAEVRALAVHDDGSGPALHAAGTFTAIGQVPAQGIARWNGVQWSGLGLGVAGSPFQLVNALASRDDGSGSALWVGGSLRVAGGRPSLGIARWGDACGCTGTAYCTAKTSSFGCLPSMGWWGITNLTASQPFMLFASQVLNNKHGLLFYGTSGADSKPFLGGTLCVRSPIRRTPVQWSGGNPPPDDCSGSFALDFKGYALSGVDPALVAGVSVNAQYWYRDPADSYGSGTTDAVAFTLCP